MMKRLFWTAFIYMLLGLSFGVFYREFTKFNQFEGTTMLSILHVHTLVLGMFFFLLLILLDFNFKLSENKRFKAWLILYNVAFLGTLSSMLLRGVLQVKGLNMDGLSHIAGTFHTLMGISLVLFMLMLKKALFSKG